MTENDEIWGMLTAFEESKMSKSADYLVFPYVGAVIIDQHGIFIAKAHKGEDGWIGHAEQIAIDKAIKAGYTDFSGMTIFTTFEPCTYRKISRVSCAQRIIDLKFKKVLIGALDPHPAITGQGEQYLRIIGNMEVERFPTEFERKIRELNKSYYHLCFSKTPSALFKEALTTDQVEERLKHVNVEFATFIYSEKTNPTESGKIDNTTPLKTETFSGEELVKFCGCVAKEKL